MQFQEFPKWIYPEGVEGKAVLVQDAEQEAALMPPPDSGLVAPDEPQAPVEAPKSTKKAKS